MSKNWLTYSSYIQYKNECFDVSCQDVSGTDIKTNTKTTDCKQWTDYAEYMKHKNRKLMVQDIDGTHESLTGNSRLINM
tara:strand:- start:342 stop:578 length:237 start_codon:yes stop_codon:yes gene_type:complete